MRRSIERLYRAMINSLEGCRYAWLTQQAFRLECYLGVVFLPIVYLLHLSYFKKIFLLVLFFMILVVEIINSAIETIVDRISLDIHPLSKAAKDLGSCAVLFIISINLVVWILMIYAFYYG